MQYLLIHWFFGSGNKSESLDGFSIGVKYTFKHWSSISSLILHSLLFSFPDNFITIPGNFLVCLAIIKDPFRNLKRSFNYFLSSLVATDLVVGTIMDPVSVAFHTSKGLQLNIVDIKILHILYFILCRYGQICGRIIASEVQNNCYLQARYFNIPLNLAGGTRVFFCIVPTRIYILLLYICKYCCSQHVWGYHLCSCRNT